MVQNFWMLLYKFCMRFFFVLYGLIKKWFIIDFIVFIYLWKAFVTFSHEILLKKKSGSILTFGRHTTFTFCTKLCYNFMCFLCLVLSVVSVSNLIYLGHKCWVFWLFLLLYNISLASFRVLITLVDDTSFFDSGLWVIHANLII